MPRLQRVLNAAARVVCGTHKFDRGLTHLLHSELYWLDVPQRIQFKLRVTVHRYRRGNAMTAASLRPTRLVAAAPLSKSPSADRTTTSSHQFRPSGVYCCRPDSHSLPDYLRDPSLKAKFHYDIWSQTGPKALQTFPGQVILRNFHVHNVCKYQLYRPSHTICRYTERLLMCACRPAVSIQGLFGKACSSTMGKA